ncbi:phospholipid carrier-dependent glycosyltransferase [Nodosilinea sp. AN01ver1]|uniref:phospholipid carrier-dependent glycosyltransferase n=1 Tax=Nodosilinea sp. AN01ver1 TaxID=3423362 RepID=UPI003D310212
MRRVVPLGWGMLGIGAIALTLRLWHLGDPTALVFDEVYYVPFALNYLQGTPSFDAHPPLAKYLIALGLWLGQWPAAWLDWPQLEVDGLLVSPLAYRWLNALVGASIPVLLAALALALSEGYSPQRRRTFALLAGLLMTTEGLTLVESRLALINIYGLALGLLGQWAWIRAGRSQHPSRWRWLASIALGAAINVKWNWAGFWLGLLLWDVLISDGEAPHPKSRSLRERDFEDLSSSPSPLRRRGWACSLLPAGWDNPWRKRVAYLGVIPMVTYLLLWLPHLALTGESLLGIHRQLWSTHQSIAANASHDYCSPWYSWPIMARPVAYFFERSGQGATAIATTIHAMGNPVLWWLSTAAVLALTLAWLARRLPVGAQHAAPLPPHAVVPFILLNYLANWLPWALVSRCTFLYHAMGMVAFSALGLAWLMAQWWQNPRDRPLALLLLGAIALSFWFWLPLYLGLPLSPASLQQRWLLPGWI